MKTCSFTGHRRLPEDRLLSIRQALRQEVEKAVAEGFVRFISGFSEGADLEFAAIVAEIKRGVPSLYLEAALPHRAFLASKNQPFAELIAQCDRVTVESEDNAPDCVFARNLYLVRAADLVIAVYNGFSGGGTSQTVRYAKRLRRELRIIKP